MLEQICDFVHNYFVLETKEGTFTITGGTLSISGLINGQRFRIRGSALNDGIYTYTDGGILDDDCDEAVCMGDETFTGKIDLMGVPKSMLKLSAEIREWVQTNAGALNSPYTSESFGGYTYTKATGIGANGATGGALSWQDMFRTKLNRYRKLA